MTNVAERADNKIHNTNTFEYDTIAVEFPSCGAILRGNLYVPQGVDKPMPAIAMAPGMSGVKEGSVNKYATFFAQGGFTVLSYDNINFGDSGGEPRQEADVLLQRRGYRDAITFLTLRPEVDADRIGIWGTSLSGGHVLEVAAHDRRVKCVVSQIPGMSGFARFKAQRPEQREATLALQNADREARFRGEPPKMIKAVSDVPGEPCVMPGPHAFAYFTEQARQAPNWRNEVTIRSTEIARGLENQSFIPYIWPTPLMMIVAVRDELGPSDMAIKAYQDLAVHPKKLVLIPGHHFSPYDEQFALTGNEARDWFTRHLYVGGSVALN